MRRLVAVTVVVLACAGPARAATDIGRSSPLPVLPLTVTTAHFAVHYTTASGDSSATTDLAAQTLAANAETALEVFESWGYPAPLDDGDGRLDITISKLPTTGVAGITFPKAAVGVPLPRSSAEIGIMTGYAQARSLVAHEVFHAIQFAVAGAYGPGWALESSARWAEHAYRWGDSFSTLPDASYLTHLDVSLDCKTGCPDGGYERWLFWKFLSDRYGLGIVHEYLDVAAAAWRPSIPVDPAALLATLLRAHGTTLAQAWNDFAVAEAGSATAQAATAGATVTTSVSHLAARYVRVRAAASGCATQTLHVLVTAPSGVGRPAVVVGAAVTPTADGAADVAWDTCGPQPVVVLPNGTSDQDAQSFTVATSVGATPPTVPATTKGAPGDVPPELTPVGVPAVLRVAAARPVVSLAFGANAPGRVELALGGVIVATRAVVVGTNVLHVPLPKARRGTRAQLVLTSISPGGTRGASLRVTVVFG